MKRTHLPLNALRVYDAAARHLSFTRAADELAVTPAAVGQQVRALEDVLGVVLFRRLPGGLELTPEGEAGLTALRDGFLQFEESVRAMRGGQGSDVLTIAAPRDLTGRWLLPKLAQYASAVPGTRFRLESHDTTPDFTEANLDLAIAWGAPATGLEHVSIDPRGMVTVGIEGAPDRRIIWSDGDGDGGALRVADAGLALDAAIARLGTATVPRLLAAEELSTGRLVESEGTVGEGAYHLIAPTPQWRQGKVQMLVAALSTDISDRD